MPITLMNHIWSPCRGFKKMMKAIIWTRWSVFRPRKWLSFLVWKNFESNVVLKKSELWIFMVCWYNTPCHLKEAWKHCSLLQDVAVSFQVDWDAQQWCDHKNKYEIRFWTSIVLKCYCYRSHASKFRKSGKVWTWKQYNIGKRIL